MMAARCVIGPFRGASGNSQLDRPERRAEHQPHYRESTHSGKRKGSLHGGKCPGWPTAGSEARSGLMFRDRTVARRFDVG
jgi:hypothetical protein